MTREDIIHLAREAGIARCTCKSMTCDMLHSAATFSHLAKFAALVAAAERSRCIAVIENERYFWSHQDAIEVCNLAIDSIRARGQT